MATTSRVPALQSLGMLRQGPAAAHLVGMPWAHAQIFMQVAMANDCVISSRQLGRVCTGLMSGGYDTKGFRVKSKSCDFGPMAGFVCVDERLHKKGAAYNETQKKDVAHAIHGDKWDKTAMWKATSEQICLTEARLNELREWKDPQNRGAHIDVREVRPDILIGSVTTPVSLDYVLRRETRHGDSVWALYYRREGRLPNNNLMWRAAWDIVRADNQLEPLLALVNPYPAYPRGHYKNCCTGDYDLFGVWPKKEHYQPTGEDRRIAGMPLVNANQQIAEWEDKRLGNISNRVHTIAQMINSAVHAAAGGKGPARDVIHHSDEGGRPFISGIDDHVIAFIPAGSQGWMVGVESPGGHPNPQQWARFLKICYGLGYQVILNAHWLTQLRAWGLDGIGSTGDARGWQTPHSSKARAT